MNDWQILGIEPTNDIETIKSAYARKSRLYHPETNPEEFQQLHMAYKSIMSRVSERQNRKTMPEYNNPQKYGRIIIEPSSKNPVPEVSLEDIPELNKKTNKSLDNSADSDDSFFTDLEFLEQIDKATINHQNAVYEKYGLDTLNDLLLRQAGYSEWKKFVTSKSFLDNQYDEEYIKNAASCIASSFNNAPIDKKRKRLIYPPHAFVYITIAYGCFFPAVLTPMEATEHVYKSYMLEPYNTAFSNYRAKRITYTSIEKDPVLSGERFAFYVYRNILEIFYAPYMNVDLLRQWLAWGLAEEHSARMPDIFHHAATHGVKIPAAQTQHTEKIFRSPVIFELLSYLLTQKTTPPVYKEVLKNMCETFMMNPGCCDEIKSLHQMCMN